MVRGQRLQHLLCLNKINAFLRQTALNYKIGLTNVGQWPPDDQRICACTPTLISALCVPGIERHTVTKHVIRNTKIKRQQSCSIP